MKSNNLELHASRNPADKRTLVYYPYTWGASDYDTGDRLDMAAAKRIVAPDGTKHAFDFVADHMPGTGRISIDKATRQQLRTPIGAADLAKRYGEALRRENIFNDYDTVIAAGNSGRGPQVARMILGILDESKGSSPFTHVMTADGFDANAPHSTHFSILRGGWFLVRHASRMETNFSVPRSEKRSRNLPYDIRAVAYKRAEACALGHLYRTTTETTDALCGLAGQIIVPYLNIGFAFGISGIDKQVLAFNLRLRQIHKAAIVASGGEGAPFQAIMENYGHGDLLNPTITAGHAALTLSLTDTMLAQGFEILP